MSLQRCWEFISSCVRYRTDRPERQAYFPIHYPDWHLGVAQDRRASGVCSETKVGAHRAERSTVVECRFPHVRRASLGGEYMRTRTLNLAICAIAALVVVGIGTIPTFADSFDIDNWGTQFKTNPLTCSGSTSPARKLRTTFCLEHSGPVDRTETLQAPGRWVLRWPRPSYQDHQRAPVSVLWTVVWSSTMPVVLREV